MKKFIRLLLLLASTSVFVISVAQIGQFWKYEDILADVGEQLRLEIAPSELSDKIQNSITNAEFDDARNYLAIAEEHQINIDHDYFERQLSQQDKSLQRIVKNVSDFAEGFMQGESESIAGVAGAVSADFTVIGDVRDLRKEYANYQADKPVNEVIAVLSGAGIGLTALTVGSLGTAAPAKTGASTIKLAVKTQRLTARFQKQILKLGRKVFDWPAFTRAVKQDKSVSTIRRSVNAAYHPKALEPLKAIATRVNSIRKTSSTADTLFLLKYVDNTNDLRHLEKVTIKHGAKTKGLFKLLGKGAIRTTKVLKRSTELLLSIISTFLSGLLSVILFIGRRAV